MTKLLSQEEIDALLSSSELDVEEEALTAHDQTPVCIYDFRHPDRVSKDQMRALRTIHERFGRALATFLSSTLRLMVDIKIDSIDQVTYSEYAMSLSTPSSIYVIRFNHLGGNGLIEVSPDLFFFLIDRLLGGPGKSDFDNREVTIIEQKIMEKILASALVFLGEAWEAITPLDPVLESFETNAQFVQIAPPSETVVIVIFDVVIRDVTFQLNLAIPYYVIEPVIAKLSAKSWISFERNDDGEDATNLIKESLVQTEAQLIANLGSADITIKDFIELQKGDIVQLNERPESNMKIMVNEKLKFLGSPGVKGRHKAIQVQEIVTIENERYYSK